MGAATPKTRLIEFLEDFGVDYKTEGGNVTEGWVEIRCVFPLCDDPSFHLGISPDLYYHCWICGEKGGIRKLVREICSQHRADFKSTYNHYFSDLGIPEVTHHHKLSAPDVLTLPEHIENELPLAAKQYLLKRRYDPDIIIQKYGLKWGNRLSDFNFRIIVPVFYLYKMVGFVGRAISDGVSPKYKNAKDMNTKQHLYNIDRAGDSIAVVEGIFDAWRIGDGAVATFGIEWTSDQVSLLIKKKIKHAIIIFDGERNAQKKARALGSVLSGFMDVEIIEPDADVDPDTMSEDDLVELRQMMYRR